MLNDYEHDLQGIFSSIRDHGLPADLARVARGDAYGAALRAQETNQEAAGFLAWYEAIGRGAGFVGEFLKQVQAVTPEQLAAVAADSFQRLKGATVLVMPRPRVEGAS
jgi:predicted Zn-dependent peptidase